LSSGSTAPQELEYFEDGKFPFVRVKDLTFPENWKFVSKTRNMVNEKAVEEKRLVLAEKGSVIFPKSGVSLLHNKRAILNQDSYVVNHFAILKPNKNIISSEYLYYVLKKIDMGEYCNRTTLPSLNLSIIQDILIPIPSLKEQKEIVENIEEEESHILKEMIEIKKRRENIGKLIKELFSN
jgi:type I restriction enzyme S subunit